MYISHENFDKYHKQQKKLIRSLPSSAWTNRVSDNIKNLGLYIEGSETDSLSTHSAQFILIFSYSLTMDEEQEQKLAQFCSVTGADTERAQFYLQASGWDTMVR